MSGHVSTADGSPIQEALVEFQGIPLCPDLCTQPQTSTDGDGGYSMDLPDGAYRVYAFFVYPSGGMMTLDAQQDSVIPGAGDYEVDFIMPGANTVDGGNEPAPTEQTTATPRARMTGRTTGRRIRTVTSIGTMSALVARCATRAMAGCRISCRAAA